MSSTRKSPANKAAKHPISSFQLDNIDSMISSRSGKKGSKDVPPSSSKVAATRSKASGKRKRDAEEDSSRADIEKQLQEKLTESLSLMKGYLDGVASSNDKKMDEARIVLSVRDQQIKDLQQERNLLAEKFAQSDAHAKEKIREAIQAAMVSASRAFLEARIKMAREAGDLGFNIPTWDLADWEKALEVMNEEEDEEAEKDQVEAKTDGEKDVQEQAKEVEGEVEKK